MLRGDTLPGFVASRDASFVCVVDASFEAGCRALGLLGRGGIERALALGRPIAGGRGVAVILKLPGSADEIVVRELRHGGLLGPLLRTAYWGTRRVLGELAVTRALHSRAAPVPQPVLALARRLRGPFWRCAIGTLRLPGTSLASALAGAPGPGAREAALRAAAIAARRLHDLGCRHADLNASNVLIAERNGDVSARLIDLDRARSGGPVPARRRAREIARLWRSLAKRGAASAVDATERDAFVAAYCAGDAALERSLRSQLRSERLRSALHALHYSRR